MDGVEIRNVKIDSRRSENVDWHDLFNMSGFNTDGIDVSGRNVHIHHCDIWNQDDTIAVKECNAGGRCRTVCSENMLIENNNLSGVGASIGSIRSDKDHVCVRNITFRNIHMHHTFKGIYWKIFIKRVQNRFCYLISVLIFLIYQVQT